MGFDLRVDRVSRDKVLFGLLGFGGPILLVWCNTMLKDWIVTASIHEPSANFTPGPPYHVTPRFPPIAHVVIVGAKRLKMEH